MSKLSSSNPKDEKVKRDVWNDERVRE